MTKTNIPMARERIETAISYLKYSMNYTPDNAYIIDVLDDALSFMTRTVNKKSKRVNKFSAHMRTRILQEIAKNPEAQDVEIAKAAGFETAAAAARVSEVRNGIR